MLKEKILDVLKSSNKPAHFFRLFDKIKDENLTIFDYKKELKALKDQKLISISKKDVITLNGVTYPPVSGETRNKGSNKYAKEPRTIEFKSQYYGKAYAHDGKFQIKVSGVNRLFNINNYNLEQDLFEGAVVVIKPLVELCVVNSNFYECEIIEFVGDGNIPQFETLIAIRNHDLPHEFSKQVDDELKSVDLSVSKKERAVRVDLTHLNFITIDGDDSRDFDDAVYCEVTDDGYDLYVAIADVSHYVVKGTKLDEEALSRATSVYFPNTVIPMLPFLLSNGLCSLNPKEERYALTVKIKISKTGSMKDYVFMNSIIESKERMTYNNVGKILEDKDEETIKKYSHIHQDILNLHSVYESLRKHRENRGALDFDKKESKITFNEDNSIKDVYFYERNVSHKVIEECMLAANVCAAKLLDEKKVPALFRVHDEPKDEKLGALKEFLKTLGLGLKGKEKEKITPHHYKRLLEKTSDRADFDLIQMTVLRSMAQAKYQPDNNGHFGLAYESYTHFTSPIRRYPDLLVHRAIKSLIFDNKAHTHIMQPTGHLPVDQLEAYPYTLSEMIELGEHCSMAERRADDASRDVYEALKCHFLKDHISETFDGRISYINKSAVYVELSRFLMEGVIYYADLPEYFIYMEEKAMIKGKNSKKTYQLGDLVQVKIIRINHESKKVILGFV